jgi:type VI protein secretion system component VasK
MGDIGTPADPPPIEPTSGRWWRDRMTDLGFWAILVILYLVAVLLYGQFAGNSGSRGTMIVTLLLLGIGALVVLGVMGYLRRRVEMRKAEAEEAEAEESRSSEEGDERAAAERPEARAAESSEDETERERGDAEDSRRDSAHESKGSREKTGTP